MILIFNWQYGKSENYHFLFYYTIISFALFTTNGRIYLKQKIAVITKYKIFVWISIVRENLSDRPLENKIWKKMTSWHLVPPPLPLPLPLLLPLPLPSLCPSLIPSPSPSLPSPRYPHRFKCFYFTLQPVKAFYLCSKIAFLSSGILQNILRCMKNSRDNYTLQKLDKWQCISQLWHFP